MFGDGLVQSLNSDVGVHRVRQSPTLHLARGPIHDGHHVEEAVLDRRDRDIGAPFARQGLCTCPIEAGDLLLSQQMRVDRMLGVRL